MQFAFEIPGSSRQGAQASGEGIGMRFVLEIPDQLIAAASAMGTGAACDVISGGAAPTSATPETAALDAISAGEAQPPLGGVAVAGGSDAAIDGGSAPDES